MSGREELLALADRIKAGEHSNALDVQIDLALFVPGHRYVAVRANAAATKVIYTDTEGQEHTHWAIDWSRQPETAPALRSLASEPSKGEG